MNVSIFLLLFVFLKVMSFEEDIFYLFNNCFNVCFLVMFGIIILMLLCLFEISLILLLNCVVIFLLIFGCVL